MDASTIRKRVRASVRTLEKRHTPNAVKNGRSSIEQLVFCIASRQTPERKAQGALRDLKTQFAGWNEVRVSSVLELADILRQNDVPSPIQKSEQIIRTLARTYADARKLNFDELTRDRAEEIRVYMTRKLALPSPVIADFLFSSLNYPHLPVDEQTGRVLQRLGLITNKADFPKLEKIVSEGLTAREAAHFYRVLEMHASQTCLDKAPLCSKCILLSNCPDGQKRLADAKAAALKAEADAKAAVKAAAAKAAADAALAAKAAAKAKAQAKAEALAAEKAAAKAAKEAAKKKSAPAKSKKGGQKPDPGGSRRSKK